MNGPKGSLNMEYLPYVTFELGENQLLVKNVGETKENRKFHGLYRSLAANMVTGVSEGFTKKMEIRGQGYRASSGDGKIELHVGHSHPVFLDIPDGIECKIEEKRGEKLILIELRGNDKQQLGQFAEDIRKVRPPEPYKGKGIRYSDEYVRQKQGKKTIG